MTRRLRLLVAGGLVVAGLGGAGTAEAQGQEALDRVDALVEEARYGEARETLEEWWNESGPTASRDTLQRGLWLRALLTVDPVMAEMDYRRLVVEFPGGRHSDQALLRLARGAEFMDDPDAARRYLDILVADYPDSPLRAEARTLIQRLNERADAEVEAEVEPDTAVSAAPEDPDSTPTTEPEEGFAVQLGAFSTRERARALAASAREAGLDVRIVQVEGSDLFRVRLGAFATREEAETEAARVRSLGLEALVSSDRRRERPTESVPGRG
ncbi:MAG: SPOR domain-containing protein [bacterium]